MSKLIDITGKRYNHLTVIRRVENAKNGVAVWECRCDCGNITKVRGSNLKSGAVKSCGCLRHTTKPTLKHNMSHTRLYRTWAAMKQRCYGSSNRSLKDYGGRGIKMCEEWRESFELFMEWAMSNGYSDDLTIERINVDGDYCPENCMWIPWEQQQGNRRMNLRLEHNGKTQNLAAWCRELSLPYSQIHNRIYKLGWSFERAISEPVHAEKRNKK